MSGFSALAYEIVWMRMLAQVLGSTMAAVTTVLCVFMGGLAAGSFLFGRWADRWSPRGGLLGFAAMQAGVAVSAAVVPVLLGLADAAYVWFHRNVPGSAGAVIAMRVGVSAAILTAPVVLMGGALPAICRYAVRGSTTFGSRAGLLYAVNTAGGLAGCAVTGFGMIEVLGLRATSYYAAAVNALAGAVAYALCRGAIRSVDAPTDESVQMGETSEPCQGKAAAAMAIAVAGVSGFTALGGEVLWTRVFSFFLGSTVYTFAVVLMTYLVGISIGASVSSRVADRVRALGLFLGAIQVALGALVIVAPSVLCYVFRVRAPATELFEGACLAPVSDGLLAAGAGLLLPAFLMGATTPAAMRWFLTWRGSTGRTVGSVLAANTLGATLGPVVVSFVLLPRFGVQYGLLILAGINIATGLALMAVSHAEFRWPTRIGLGLAVAILAATSPFWQRNSVHEYLRDRALGDVVEIRDGSDSTVTVSQHRGAPLLTINGTPMASTCLGMKLRAHLPTLLHDDARRVLVIGFGTGTTAGTVATRYPGAEVDCVEVSPTVVGMAEHFRDGNHDVRRNPSVQVIIEDARNYVARSDRLYDAIIVDAPHPFAAMASALFNREFYEACGERLAEGGILLQWIPLYLQPAFELKAMVRTFVEVFPACTIWGGDDINLVAVRGPLRIPMGRLARRLANPSVQDDLGEKATTDPAAFLAKLFLMGPPAPSRWVGEGPIVTDDRPFIEFSIPRHLRDASPRGRPVRWGEIAVYRSAATAYLAP